MKTKFLVFILIVTCCFLFSGGCSNDRVVIRAKITESVKHNITTIIFKKIKYEYQWESQTYQGSLTAFSDYWIYLQPGDKIFVRVNTKRPKKSKALRPVYLEDMIDHSTETKQKLLDSLQLFQSILDEMPPSHQILLYKQKLILDTNDYKITMVQKRVDWKTQKDALESYMYHVCMLYQIDVNSINIYYAKRFNEDWFSLNINANGKRLIFDYYVLSRDSLKVELRSVTSGIQFGYYEHNHENLNKTRQLRRILRNMVRLSTSNEIIDYPTSYDTAGIIQ